MTLQDIEAVALRLGPLREQVAFLGGSAIGLLITDPASPSLRVSDDIDVIIDVPTYSAYVGSLRDQLADLGFMEDSTEGAPTCRWVVDGLKIDIMPTNIETLGFTNRWYADALKAAAPTTLPGGTVIHVIGAPHFLATKIEAFHGRGSGDFLASHDIEDLIALIDGRPELVAEVARSETPLREYIQTEIGRMLRMSAFTEALTGHMPGDLSGQSRVPIIRERMRAIASSPPDSPRD